MFEWSNDYSVQIGSIDGQHRNLFAIGHELHAAMTAGHGKAALVGILDRLVQYTAVHFAHEERLMRQNGYPDLAAHKAEHDALTKQVLQFQDDFQSGRATMTIQILHFIKEWLQKHIKGSDMRYVPCLSKSEPQAAGLRCRT
jgi:hemerythrin